MITKSLRFCTKARHEHGEYRRNESDTDGERTDLFNQIIIFFCLSLSLSKQILVLKFAFYAFGHHIRTVCYDPVFVRINNYYQCFASVS